MDQVTASVETIHEGPLCVLTTRYLSECGCEWVVDMWGNVRRVKICPRDTNDIRWENQLKFDFDRPAGEFSAWWAAQRATEQKRGQTEKTVTD